MITGALLLSALFLTAEMFHNDSVLLWISFLLLIGGIVWTLP